MGKLRPIAVRNGRFAEPGTSLTLVVSLLAALSWSCAAERPNLKTCQLCFTARARFDPEDPRCRSCYEIRTRDPRAPESDRWALYAEEYAYVESRRRRIGGVGDGGSSVASEQVPTHLTGVALSGGGIRSASFGLGALQALEAGQVIEQTDYMSAVSGGGYIAGWVQAHLGAHQFYTHDVYDFEVVAPDFAALVANHGDNVEQLRTHTGFLNQGGWFEAPLLFWDWLKRWPGHFVLDDLLHLRGKYNWQHVIEVYEKRIRKTYFRGDAPRASGARPIADTRLADVNDPKRQNLSPYLILNANLTNRGPSRVGIPKCAPDVDGKDCDSANAFNPQPTQWNFEFTRDFTGSDGIGYVDSRAFGRDVVRVLPGAKGRPAAVIVGDGSNGEGIKLSTAVAASGAAFDSAAVLYKLDYPGVTELGKFLVGGVLNLYLGLEVPNFSRSCEGWWTPADYLRMVTYQRASRWLDTGSRWLYVTDGGHYENLGVLSLLRRGVSCVVAFDATADPKRTHEDLKTLRRRIEEDLGMRLLGDLPSDGDPAVRHRFVVAAGDDSTPRAVILYLKTSVDQTQPHLRTIAGFSEFRAGRDIDALANEDVQAVHQLFTDVARVAGELDLPLGPDFSLEAEATIDRELWEYYEKAKVGPSQRRVLDLEEEIAELRERIVELEVELVGLQRERTTLEQQRQEKEIAKDKLSPTAGVDEDVSEEILTKQFGTRGEIKGDIRELNDRLGEVETRIEAEQRALQEARERIQEKRRELDEELSVDIGQVPTGPEKVVLAARRIGDPRFRERVAPTLVQFEAARHLRLERFQRAAREYRRGAERDRARDDRIHKVLSFAGGPTRGAFPNDSTLQQWYSWERFDAYRLLGYQTASTFLERLRPDAAPDPATLDWCKFADPPPQED